MIHVDQTIVDPGKGNCMQAVVASLFEKKLEDVPNFIEIGSTWMEKLAEIYKKQGYDWPMAFYIEDLELEVVSEALHYDGGVNGYFYASVKSQTFDNVSHAVVVDRNLNIVHDPNPNKKALLLGPKDVLHVLTTKNNWYIQDGRVVLDN